MKVNNERCIPPRMVYNGGNIMAKRILRSIFSLVITSSVMATAVMASSAAQTELYVNSDYNSETEGWGTTRFANYEKALAYAKDNAKKATMIFEKTTTVSGNCFTNEIHKNLTGLGVVVQDGAVVGNAASKWDMTYPVTIKPGARLVTARTVNAGVGNSHIKNTLTVGEAGSDKQAVIDFHKGSYQDMSIAVLYNGKLVANNALIKVGDLGLTGTASINDSEVQVKGIVAFGKGFYSQTMTDSVMYVKGHNLMNENKYYSTTGTLLNKLTMENSQIVIDDGADSTSAEAVTIKQLTMKNGSSVTVEDGTSVTVSGKLTMDSSSCVNANVLNVDSNGEIIVDHNGILVRRSTSGDARALGEQGVNKLTGDGKVTINAAGADLGKTSVYVGNDFTGTLSVTGADGTAAVLSGDGYAYLAKAEVQRTTSKNEVALYANLQDALDDAQNGDTVTLLNDAVIAESIVLDSNITVTIDGNGYSIKPSETYKDTQNAAIMLGDTVSYDAAAEQRSYTIKNVVIDGFDEWSAIRAQGVTLTLEECTIKNFTQAGIQGLLRLDYTEATIKNTVLCDNSAPIGIAHNYNNDVSNTALTIENCVIENNLFSGVAAVYYALGDECSITDSKLVGNTVSTNGNAATVYLGFQENCTVTDCLFRDNKVITSSDSKRVSGGVFFGYSAEIIGNVFDNNTAENKYGSSGLGQSVCTSVYYDCVLDLSGNYMNGREPVEGEDYGVIHKDGGEGRICLDNYYTDYWYNDEGELVLYFNDHVEFNTWFMVLLKKFTRECEITVNHNEGGTVSPNGVYGVKYGENAVVTVTPDEGYEIESVTLDGEAVEIVNEYAIERVTADRVIDVVFKKSAP